MRQEAMVAWFKVLPQHLPGATAGSVEIIGVQGRIRTGQLPNPRQTHCCLLSLIQGQQTKGKGATTDSILYPGTSQLTEPTTTNHGEGEIKERAYRNVPSVVRPAVTSVGFPRFHSRQEQRSFRSVAPRVSADGSEVQVDQGIAPEWIALKLLSVILRTVGTHSDDMTSW